jgi:hypothetical protein
MADQEFEVTYGVDDGYAGKSRPHSFTISAQDVEGMSEKHLSEFFWNEIERDFRQSCNPYSDQEAEFIEWAKSVQREQEQDAE